MRNKEKISINNLPKKYHFAYQYCEFLNNNLVATYNGLKQSDMFGHSIKFKNKKEINTFMKLDFEQMIDKLWANEKYSTDAFMIIHKALVEALLFEYITYMSEVLLNILKGNISICYTLLRKPFKEILTVFELICKNPITFFRNFWDKEPKDFNPQEISDEEKLQNIKDVINVIDSHGIYSSKVIYDLRFKRENMLSFDAFWNKAIHLITSASGIKTEKRNFNMIFAGKEEKDEMTYHLFYALPIILIYTNDVVESLALWFSRLGENDNYFTRRLLGYFAWSYEYHLSDSSRTKVRRALANMFKGLNCPKCKKNLKFNKLSLREYFYQETFCCQSCGHTFKGIKFNLREEESHLHPLLKQK